MTEEVAAEVAGPPDDDTGRGSPARRAPSSARTVLLAVGFSVFVAADDLTVVSTMLRPMIRDVGLSLPDGLDDAAWIVNAYLIAFVAVMPVAGRISDVIGRRRTFLAAYAVFGVGTIWIPLSDSLGPLLVGRVLTALGGGAMVPVALAVVGDVYAEHRRTRALGALGAIETLGWVWGPLYGAMLVRFVGWRWQFWLNVPLAIIGAAAVWWALDGHERPRRATRVDWVGAALLTTVLVALNLALLGSAEVQSVRGLDELTGGGGTDLRWLHVVAAVAAVALVLQQRRLRRAGGRPVVDVDLFRGRGVRVALVVNFVVGAALVIAMVDVPLFVNAVEVDLERAAVVSGWVLSALTASMALTSYLGGRLTERTWWGPPIVIGLVAALAAYVAMGTTWDAATPHPLLALQLALLGAGIGLTIAPTTSAVVDRADPDERGAAAAIVIVVRMIGLSVGLSALTAWGLARFEALRADIELPPIDDPGFRDALTAATERLTAQSIADTFLASAVALGVGLVLSLALVRRADDRADDGDGDGELAPAAPDDDGPPPTPPPTRAPAPTAPIPARTASMPSSPSPAPPEPGSPGAAASDPTGPGDDATEPTASASATDDSTTTPRHHARGGRVGDHLGAVLAALGLGLIGSLVLSLVLLARVESARSELDTTRDDLARVEAGAALFAAQVNGFVETVDGLGPSIGDGLDQAITGLEEFGASSIEFTVPIDQTVSISETFELERTVTVPIRTSIPIQEEIDTTITVAGPFGVDVPLDITVPVDIEVPIDLVVDIPIDESVPIEVDVPIRLDVPIAIDVSGTELDTLAQTLAEGLRAFQEGLGGLTGG
ncbi:MFS transporter [Ilumatobacter sp.]|uniref:MFS transporter n=1 Tax=Ilumatobacter sp. TaxID=1967498 RepID=UPI003B51F1DE